MRSSSYCSADAYDMQSLMDKLMTLGFKPECFDDVIYISSNSLTDPQTNFTSSNPIDIFFFQFGSVVIWGADDAHEKIILNYLDGCEKGKLQAMASDQVLCIYDPQSKKTYIDEEKNTIALHEHNNIFIKLSVSYAAAQSVKLETLEKSVGAILNNTKTIQEELARTGSTSLSKTEITKKIGILFSERYLVNLYSDVLDTPEFFWRRPSYEPIYLMAANFYDISPRQNAMNNRLDVIQELYNLLSSEVNHRHSSRLEWIIIALITIEVILGLEGHGILSAFLEYLKS